MAAIPPQDAAALISALTAAVAGAPAAAAAVPPAEVTLKDLLTAGLIKPGEGNVTLVYRGVTSTANLLASGLIEFQGETFSTPDAFATKAKQTQVPDRDTDNGWRSVLVDGTVLEDLRYSYIKGKKGDKADTKPDSKPALTADGLPILPSTLEVPPQALAAEAGQPVGAAAGGEQEEAQQNWVQCAHCQTWRIVPDEFWPEIDNGGDDDWFCKESTWDVTLYEPYTPSCK